MSGRRGVGASGRLIAGVLGVVVCLVMPLRADEPPSFAKDVAPILAANCAGCHAAGVPRNFCSTTEGFWE
jgi:hypothetical protein